jgi:plastocyanin
MPHLSSRLAAPLLALAAAYCTSPAPGPPPYRPRTRAFTITTVPLLTKELVRVYPFLVRDFANGGVLEGKEVYAFMPGEITAVAGDTLALTLVNPEDDPHSFVLPDLAVPLPPQTTVQASYVARRAGIYRFLCSVPSHLPYMSGTLVVLPATGFPGP